MNGITLVFSITDLHSSTMNKKSRRPSSAKAKRDKRTTRPLPGGTKTSLESSVRSDLSNPDQMRGPDPKNDDRSDNGRTSSNRKVSSARRSPPTFGAAYRSLYSDRRQQL